MESFEPIVIVIDAQADRASLIKQALQDAGYRVSMYTKTSEAADLSSDVSCVLLAESEGVYDWIRSVRAGNDLQQVPILVITRKMQSWQEGVSDYLLWPCHIQALLARIKPYADMARHRFLQMSFAASEEVYREIYNASSNAIIIHDIETGRILSVNKTYESLFGFSCEEAMRVKPQAASSGEPPYTEKEVVQWMQKAVHEGPQVFEWHARRKDGSLFWCEVFLRTAQIGGDMRILAIVRDVTQRKNAEISLVKYRDKLRSLASEMNMTEERQRRYIASCLHDGACQELALAILKLQTFQASLGGEFASPVSEVVESLRDVVRDLRDLTFDLSPPVLYMSGLEAAIEELLEDQFRSYTHITVDFQHSYQKCHLEEEMRCILYQCVRELIVNIIKHARATKVSVVVEKTVSAISITVKDNGVGFDVEKARASFTRDSGFGLFNIAERLDFAGGTFEMNSEIGQGSCFVMAAPCVNTHS